MQEVNIRLRFTRECLGYAKRETTRQHGVIYRMPRDGSGRIMFLASWWHERLAFAAKVLSRWGELAPTIVWGTGVDGHVKTWKRVVVRAADDSRGRARYALHEAFRPGDQIGLTAVLPGGLSLKGFEELLTIIGNYKGISPFQANGEAYGTFEVISVRPVIRVPEGEVIAASG